MKKITLLFFIAIIGSTLYGQQEKILDEGYLGYALANEEGRYEDAYTHAYNCWSTLKDIQPQRDSILGLAYYYLADALCLNERQEEALEYALEGQKLLKNSYGEEHVNYALILNMIGILHFDLNNYDLSEASYLEAIEIYRMDLPRKEYDYFGAICNLAAVYDVIGRYEDAQRLYESILKEYASDKESELYTAVLMNLALLHEGMGEYEAAEKSYLEVQTVFKENDNVQHPDYAVLLTNMGILYHSLGSYEQAENLFLQAIEIFSGELSGDFYDISSAYSGLAILYSDLAKYDKAEEYYLKTVALTKEFMGEDSYDYGWSINNLGGYYEEQGAFEKAKEKYLEAEKIFLAIFGKDHVNYAVSLSNLSSVCFGVDDWDNALRFANEALVLIEKHRGEKYLEHFILTNRIAEIHYYNKNYTESLDYAYRTLEANGHFVFSNKKIDAAWCDTILNHSFSSFPELSISLKIIYRTLSASESKDALLEQLKVVETAMTIFELRRNEYSTEEDRRYLLNRSTEWAEEGILTIEKLRNYPNWEVYKKQAFDFAEKNKSVLLTSELQTEKAYSFGDLPDSLAQKEQLLQQEYDEYKAYLSDDISEEERQEVYTYLSDLLLEKDAFKKNIETNYPKYSQLKYASTTISIEEVQQTLDAETALLEYSISDSAVTVFYVSQKEYKLYTFPIAYSLLASKISLLHQTLSNYKILVKAPEKAHQRYTQIAYWFYENLVADVLKEKKGINHLVVITDRELGHLPFETFLLEDESNKQGYKDLHYLMNDYAISYDYSATLWKENLSEGKRSNNGQLLAMAAIYDQVVDSNGNANRLPFYQQQRSTLGTLPAAIDEVNLLTEIFAGNAITGLAANERFFKQNAGEYGIIHMAMHGVLNRNSPILSSLVLTEDKDTIENNFLQAYEISKMNLNANLVVLSACETGYGKFERGNGIASLARSFMYAGVPALVVSLWQVNDQSTAMVMRYFYENMKEGNSKAVALRAAKQQYIEEVEGIYAHPAFWSSFVQLGNSQAIQLEQKGVATKYWLILAATLIFFVFVGLLKLKKREK